MTDLMRAVHEIDEHADAYRLAERYYRGRVGEVFPSEVVRRALRNQVAGFNINLARRAVDAVLDRMAISAVAVPEAESATRDLIDKVWRPNRLGRYCKVTSWAALTFGDAYLIVWPGDEDGTVDVHYNTPVTTRVFYDEEDPRRKRFAAKKWTEGDGDAERTRVNLYYADRIERYVSKNSGKVEQDSDFEPFLDDDETGVADGQAEWPITNPFGEVNVFHFRTAEPYGFPEHEAAYGPQNAITKLSATQMATIDFQGFPQRYALTEGTTEDLVDWGDDDVENDEQRRPGERDSSLKASPGTVWRLPGTKAVGQFASADVDAFIKPIGMYVRLMAAATAKPLRFFDPQGQVPSGESLRADEAPLAARIRDLEDVFSDTWSEALVFAMRVLGQRVGRVDVQWDPVHVVDDEDGWKTAQLKLDAGVPFEQVMTEAGYASDLVKRWVAQRDAAPPAAGTESGSPAPASSEGAA